MPARVGGPGTAKKNFIKKWRVMRGLTQEQLGEKIGSSKGHISNVEQGKINPAIGFLKEAAEALDTDIGSLMDRDPDEDASSDAEPILEVWNQADEAQRRQILRHSRTIIEDDDKK